MKAKNQMLYFLILKGNELIIETLPINNIHAEEFNELLNFINTKYKLPTEKLNYIANNKKFKSLFGRMNYCSDPSKAYQGFYKSLEEIIEQYIIPKAILNKSEFIEILNKRFEEDLKKRKEAYDYENTMKDSTAIKLKNTSKAHSHCLVGWKTFKFNVNRDLNFEAITNFGYGNSSYFYGKVIFKGLQIIPYSDWIFYEKANLYEIINYTRKYEVNYNSWEILFNFFVEVNNEINKSEIMFINKYIIQECEKMIEGLNKIKESNTFIFITSERINKNFNKVGHELIEFRGEKISGALDFIEEIAAFANYLDTNRYKTVIEKLNLEMKPILKNEITLIDQKLKELNNNKLKLEMQLKNAKLNYEISEFERQEYIKNQTIMNNNISIEYLSKIYIETHEEYVINEKEYKKYETLFLENEAKLNSIIHIQEKINIHLEKIDSYFTEKMRRLGLPLSI